MRRNGGPGIRPPLLSTTARERIAARRRQLRTGPPQGKHLRQRNAGCGTFVIGTVIILVLVVVLFGLIKGRFDRMTATIVRSDPRHASASDEAEIAGGEEIQLPDTLREPFNVLLIGVDKRSDELEGVRSDTLIVVHVHPQEQWASMLSIPRDSVASIPHRGEMKINGAYTYGYIHATELYGEETSPEDGGGALAAETVENFLGIEVDYIAQVDFQGFERIVDMLGGIVVDVERPLLDAEYPTENFGRERLYIPAGLQVLDGQTALRYARSRHSGSDFERSRRQQQVLQATLKEVQARGLLDQLDLISPMVENLEQNIVTTLPLDDPSVLYGLAKLARSLGSDDIVRLGITPDEVRVVQEVQSDIYWHEEDLTFLVKRFLKGPTEQAGRIQVLNGAGVQGLATRTSNTLQRRAFAVLEPGDAPELHDHTILIDYTGLPDMRQSLADLLDLESRYVYDTPPSGAPPQPPGVDLVLILGQDYQQHTIKE